MKKEKMKTIENNVLEIQIRKANPYIILYGNEVSRSVRIHSKQYERLEFLYNGPVGLFNVHAYLLGLFYTHVDSPNMHLSFPPKFLKENQIDFELFGTPLNTSLGASYCSPLDYEQVYFQSKGSFYEMNDFIPHGRFTANAPFDEKILLDMTMKLFLVLQFIPITFFITMPVWDIKTKKALGMTYKIETIHYNTFEAYDYMMKHYVPERYIKMHRVFNVNEFDYYDYYNDRIRGIVPIHYFIVSSDPEFRLEKKT
jgi:hypothetical protein